MLASCRGRKGEARDTWQGKPTTADLTTQSVALADYAAKALVAAEQLRIKPQAVEDFPLADDERAIAAELPALPAKVKKKLAKKGSNFTVAEAASMVMAAAKSFMEAEPQQQVTLILIAKRLMDCLQANIIMLDLQPAKTIRATKAKADDAVYQFKITPGQWSPTTRRFPQTSAAIASAICF